MAINLFGESPSEEEIDSGRSRSRDGSQTVMPLLRIPIRVLGGGGNGGLDGEFRWAKARFHQGKLDFSEKKKAK